MPIFFRYNDNHITVMGQTYPHKEDIKALGGRFEGERKVWQLPFAPETLTAVETLCAGSGGGPMDAALSPVPQPPAVVKAVLAPRLPREIGVEAPSSTQPGVTVAELVQQVGQLIQSTFRKNIWVMGEIQGLSRRRQGLYFNLRESEDERAMSDAPTINAVLWSSTLKKLEQKLSKEALEQVLQDNFKVRCLCRVQLYRGRAQLSLVVEDIDAEFTKGALALARERLLRELREKGLDGKNRALPFPTLPLRLGLITAEGSRAKSDFLHQLEVGGFPGRVLFCASSMQGEATAQQVPAAMARLISAGCDVIVLTRGGGSAADLCWFDRPEIAMAIAHAPLPIIAAIGHHEDRCVAEEISHQRQKTPTAAADCVLAPFVRTRQVLLRACDSLAGLPRHRLSDAALTLEQQQHVLGGRTRAWLAGREELLQRYLHHMHSYWQQKLAANEGAVARLAGAVARLAGAQLHACSQETLRWQQRLASGCQNVVAASALHLATQEKHLASADVRPWLAKGWTQLLRADKTALHSVEGVAVGDGLKALLLDGDLELAVTRVTKETRAPATVSEGCEAVGDALVAP